MFLKNNFHKCPVHKLCLVRSPNRPACSSLYPQSHPRGVQCGRSALGESPGAGEGVPLLQRWQLHLRAAAVVPPQPPGPAGRAGQAPGAGLQERAPLRGHPWRQALPPGVLQQLGPGLHHPLHTAAGWRSLRVRGSEPAERGETVPVQIHLCQRWEIKEVRAPDTDRHTHLAGVESSPSNHRKLQWKAQPWQWKHIWVAVGLVLRCWRLKNTHTHKEVPTQPDTHIHT